MISSWRRKRAAGRRAGAGKNDLSSDIYEMELTIPTHYRCPISLDLMKDPVTLSTGMTYDRESIEKWIESGNQTCPVTNQVLTNFEQIPNHAIRKMIQDWCVQNRSHGVERIPTPRIPVTPYEVSEIGKRIMGSTQRGDDKKCLELLRKIKKWAKESERNKLCMVETGLGLVLSSSFEHFSTISMQKHEALLMEILSALTWMFPLGPEGLSKLCLASSLLCISWFLKSENLAARQNSVLALKELVSADNQRHVNAITEIEGVPEALFKMVKEPSCQTGTKAALVVIYYLISKLEANEKIRTEFVDMGLVSLILEILVDAERGICERALGVLEGICGSDEGREMARKNALTVPVLVKKISRVSDMATEFSISLLWKLCKNGDGGVLDEAVQLGAFQKMLVVLQVGCDERTKEKATELLKLLNSHYKNRLECFDSSMGFKYLKRPY